MRTLFRNALLCLYQLSTFVFSSFLDKVFVSLRLTMDRFDMMFEIIEQFMHFIMHDIEKLIIKILTHKKI